MAAELERIPFRGYDELSRLHAMVPVLVELNPDNPDLIRFLELLDQELVELDPAEGYEDFYDWLGRLYVLKGQLNHCR